MSDERGLLNSAWRVVGRNKRYIFWFWALNLTLAEFGAAAYRNNLHSILDHSHEADKLLNGFNPATYFELTSRPEMGSLAAMRMPAMYLGLLFVAATIFLMPGVFRQYTSEYRVSREDFWRTCGRNLWRFVRLTMIYGIVAAVVSGILFGIRGGLTKAADKSTNEVLPFYVGLAGLVVIFLVMTLVRIWFDLAEVDIVLRDQPVVRKSVGAGLRYTRRFWGRLLGSYCAISLLALLVLAAGVWLWHVLVPPSSVAGAFLVSQAMLISWLLARFWQRATAAVFYLQEMLIAPGYARSVPQETTAAAVAPVAAPAGGVTGA
jgi:hypothetical protein